MKIIRVKGIYFIIILGFLCSSCATLFNTGVKKITIVTDGKIKSVSIDSSFKLISEPNAFYVERSKNPIKLNLQLDSTKKTIVLKAGNSVAWWSNLYFNYGIGMYIEKDHPKRYTYPGRIYLSVKDTNIILRRILPKEKGRVNWHLAIPYVNSFYVETATRYRNSRGFFGIESGLDYFYTNKLYLSLYAGAAMDYPVPIIAPYDEKFGSEHQSSYILYINARNNYIAGRFDLGYGLNFSRMDWERSFYHDTLYFHQIKRTPCLGLSLSGSYRIGNYFQVGLLYQPDLLSFGLKPYTDYQHFISFEFIWKIPVGKW